jgi:hypothetical protein
MSRGSLRVYGALDQCSVWGSRALKNVVGNGCVYHALLFIRTSECKEWKMRLVHLKAIRILQSLMLDNLHVGLVLGSRPLVT